MPDKKLLIFDCDGTLVDSEGIANRTFIKSINDLGVPLTAEEAWKHFPGTSLALCMQYVESTYTVKLPSDFVITQRALQKSEFARKLQPIDGIVEALETLSTSPKCVASNGPFQMILDNLGNTQLLDHFGDRIFSAYQINKWKPEPDLFEHAASTLGYSAGNCVVIEDSMAGLEAGKNAGMVVLAYIPVDQHYEIEIDGVPETPGPPFPGTG